MIVRILGDKQYRLADGDSPSELDQLDDQMIAAVDAGNEDEFKRLFEKMVELVESRGTPLAEDELVASDVVLPPRDVTFAEARREFTGEGLVPD